MSLAKRVNMLVDVTVVVGVILFEHGSPELLPQRSIWQVFRSQIQDRLVLVFLAVFILETQRKDVGFQPRVVIQVIVVIYRE